MFRDNYCPEGCWLPLAKTLKLFRGSRPPPGGWSKNCQDFGPYFLPEINWVDTEDLLASNSYILVDTILVDIGGLPSPGCSWWCSWAALKPYLKPYRSWGSPFGRGLGIATAMRSLALKQFFFHYATWLIHHETWADSPHLADQFSNQCWFKASRLRLSQVMSKKGLEPKLSHHP